MAEGQTTSYTKHGKNVKYGMEELPNLLIQSGDGTLSWDVLETKNHVGAIVSAVKRNAKVEFSLSGKMLEETTVAAVATAAESWATTRATSDDFGLAEGGTAIVSEVKIGEKNDDVADVSITVAYYQDMPASA